MKVLKFGGSSIKDASVMKRVAEILNAYTEPTIVVLSATGGTTDMLLQAIQMASEGKMDDALAVKQALEDKHFSIMQAFGLEVNEALHQKIADYLAKLEIFLIGINYIREATPRTCDAVIAHGELISTTIFNAYLRSLDKKSHWFDVRQVMRTDNQFGSASVMKNELKRLTHDQLIPLLQKYDIIVTQGFIGSTADGLTTTLGRGGSDYSAALLGNAMNADEIEIWTDVSGVMTADPNIVKDAFTQHDLSFQEAAELAFFGAKVLHPSTLLPAMERDIPVIVKNTFDPENPGTVITAKSQRPGICKAISAKGKTMILTVESTRMLLAYGFLEKIFEVFARYKVAVDLVSTSEISVSLTIHKKQFTQEIVDDLSQFSNVKISDDMAIIALVGDNIKTNINFLNRVFTALTGITIEMITFGTSNVNLSLVIPESQMVTCVERLHNKFFKNNNG
ncbi:lysine-sensitive aspartokinase 3 [candidate division KSB1 bacterium]|nr:lysine-sensitive aspartokinase 3 [candidate division KSB1 bacterium]